jgi:hypothetical protein
MIFRGGLLVEVSLPRASVLREPDKSDAAEEMN